MPLQITSRSNPRYKACTNLRRRRGRKKSNQFVIDGSRDLIRAIDNGIEVSEIFIDSDSDTTNLPPNSDLGRVVHWAESNKVLWSVEPELYKTLCYGERSSDVVGIASAKGSQLQEISLSECPLVVILDSVEKPGNVGAVFRTADAVGADAVILTGETTDHFNPNAIRASSGTVFSMATAHAKLDQVVSWLAHHSIPLALARVDGELPYWDLPLSKPIAIAFGNEADGLGCEWDSEKSNCFHIPMSGTADSLNVSVSTAVVLFEANRQRFNG